MIYTDALQTLIMVVGAVILTVKGERDGGGAALPGPRCQHWVGVGSRGQATRQSAVGSPRGGGLPSAAQLSTWPAPGRLGA